MYRWLTLALFIGCNRSLDATTEECSADLECLAADGVSECIDCVPICQEDHLPTEDRRHLTDPIDYEIRPPAGGPHNPCWYDWGVYTSEVPDDRWVHNQEHGGVVFLYNCPDGCEAEVEALVAAFGSRERVIISPYAGMRWRFAASAWERRILLNCLDLDKLDRFYNAHFANGPEDVASMAPGGCMEDDQTDATESDSGDTERDSGTAEDSGGSLRR